MDYSLLVGIHDVERAEQEEVESEDNEAEEEGESDGGGIGTPPDSPSNTLDSTKPLSPGEFDPTIDVYAIKSNESKLHEGILSFYNITLTRNESDPNQIPSHVKILGLTLHNVLTRVYSETGFHLTC